MKGITGISKGLHQTVGYTGWSRGNTCFSSCWTV